MVALSSHADLAQVPVPVRVTPPIAGSWQWVGTQTVAFETPTRLPMATDYQVEVPAGTVSARGSRLANAERWTFATPPPTIVSSYPSGTTAFDPVFFAAFDQTIDPAAVLRTIRVRAGTTSLHLRLATPAEVRADGALRSLMENTTAGRWIAFRSDDRLPADTDVVVTVGPGTPSAEGPRTTATAQQWRFRTHGALRVTSRSCGWNNRCEPLQPWYLHLSNPIAVDSFSEDMVRVEPPLPGVSISARENTITIQGTSKGQTGYSVTLSGVRDVFGQTLATPFKTRFSIQSGEPWLLSGAPEWPPVVVLDPAGPLRFPVYSLNYRTLSVLVRAVEPRDWPAFRKAVGAAPGSARAPKLPGRLVMTRTIRVNAPAGQAAETNVDLSQALPRGVGQLVVLVEPAPRPAEPPEERAVPVWRRRDRVLTWLQATRIGLDAFADGKDAVVWASALADGRPLAEVQLRVEPSRRTVQTGHDGTARLSLDNDSSTLVARLGDDVAVLPGSPSQWGVNVAHAEDELVWHVFDDRGLYRPGEEVKVKGWVRLRGAASEGDVRPVLGVARQVAYTLTSMRGAEIAHGTAALNRFGGFDLALKLPPTIDLGMGTLNLTADAPEYAGNTSQHAFRVQEFRRPEFEIISRAGGGPCLVGGHAIVSVTASYYARGGLANAEVHWRIAASPGSFTRPNRGDFTFGHRMPSWSPVESRHGSQVQVHKARTDASGTHALRMEFDEVDPPQPTYLAADVTVTDANRQALSSATHVLVHPSSVYVGLKTPRSFVDAGEPLSVDLIVTDLDGHGVVGRPVTVRSERLEYKQHRGVWREEATGSEVCSVTSAAEESRCTFKTAGAGTYRITASVTDASNRPNETQIRRLVGGGKMPAPAAAARETVTLIPDRDVYRAGDTAEIMVIPPFSPAEGLMTIHRSGIVRTERFTISGSSYTLRVPVQERWTPNVFVQVDVVGAATRSTEMGQPSEKLPKRPAFASGKLGLAIPPLGRKLEVQVEPQVRTLLPGADTTVNIAVRDAAGRPSPGTEVTVIVADEAVLAMAGFERRDPLPTFYYRRDDRVSGQHLRQQVLLARFPPPENLGPQPVPAIPAWVVQAANASRFAGGINGGVEGGVVSGTGEGIQLRADFNPLALFAASVVTDASGHADARVKLPDNLTRYRVMAVAATAGVQFGSGESTITTRLPLMVRTSAPRFLNLGDRAEIPVVLQNQSDTAMSVDVALRAANATILGPAGRRVSVAANDRVEVRFPATTVVPGVARFQVAATSGRWADASEVSLPVRTPATAEAFAAYGQIDDGAVAQRVNAPSDALLEFGGLDISTSSTALQSLTDAVVYLAEYPYECAEQLASRVLAVAALKDVLSAFAATGMPDAETLKAQVQRDIGQLSGLQNGDGGFALWRRGDQSWPYASVYAVHALTRARAKGFGVPNSTLESGRAYLRNIETAIPADYSIRSRRAIVAYALYVRSLIGDNDAARARSLVQEAGLPNLSFEAIGWLLPVLAENKASTAETAAVRAYLNSHANDTAAAAHFAVAYEDGQWVLFQSERRADAVVLDALVGVDPKSDLVPKIVEGLLAHRRAGRWESTQENAFVLLALARYFNAYENVTPDFVARAWLGDRFAGEHAFKGRTTERHVVQLPLKALLNVEAPADLVLAKEGPGRLYYRVGLQYAPRSLDLKPLDRGFTVERTYAAVDDPADVRRDADGTWHVRAGARVRVRVSMVAPDRRYHVALVDPLPAGFEAVNPELAGAAALPPEQSADRDLRTRRWYRARWWFDHENLRDDRAEAFTSLLWEGVYSYTYVARATTPGQFVVPPPRAEEMYHPETFGRGATDRVVVETK